MQYGNRMGMQNAAPQGQMGFQTAQAQALRRPQFGGGMGSSMPSVGMPAQPPGTIAPQAPMPAPSPDMAQPTFGEPQIMGGMNRPQPGPHPVEMPQPQQPMGRPSFGYGQGNRFGGNMGYGRGGRFGGNRGYGRFGG